MLHLKEQLKSPWKVSNLKGLLAQANTIINSTEIRLKKATDKLQVKRGENANKLEVTSTETEGRSSQKDGILSMQLIPIFWVLLPGNDDTIIVT